MLYKNLDFHNVSHVIDLSCYGEFAVEWYTVLNYVGGP